MRELAPQWLAQAHWPMYESPQDAFQPMPGVPAGGTMMELRCVVAVIRHGDRTPKE